MEYEIKEKKENQLLSRTELSMEIKHLDSANPSYATITKEIANQLKVKENLIVIKHVYPAFGEGRSDVIAYAYKDEESLKNIEPRNKKAEEDAKKAAAEKKASAEAAPAPAEKPAEASNKEKKDKAVPPPPAPAEKKEEKKEEPTKEEKPAPKEEAKPKGEK